MQWGDICLLYDQDPALKVAIKGKFESNTHKFCIWHIMRKLSEKVGSSLNSDNDFLISLKSCVYNSETPIEFEQELDSVIHDFCCKLIYGYLIYMTFRICGFLLISRICFWKQC